MQDTHCSFLSYSLLHCASPKPHKLGRSLSGQNILLNKSDVPIPSSPHNSPAKFVQESASPEQKPVFFTPHPPISQPGSRVLQTHEIGVTPSVPRNTQGLSTPWGQVVAPSLHQLVAASFLQLCRGIPSGPSCQFTSDIFFPFSSEHCCKVTVLLCNILLRKVFLP